MKSNKELTIKELNSKKKSLVTILIVLSSLILAYGVFFVTKLASGTWEANNTLGIVGLGVMVVLISNISLRLSVIQKEIKGCNDKGRIE